MPTVSKYSPIIISLLWRVIMPGFFKRPDPDKNFFQNYYDHLNALARQTAELCTKYKELKTERQIEEFMDKVISDRFLVLEPLRDGYDYMDEVLGATVLPVVALLGSVVAAVAAAWEGVHALAIHWGMADNDKVDHAANALNLCIASALALSLSVVSLLKSAISLISRPIATAEYGFAKQDTYRFYNEDKEPAVEFMREGVKDFVDSTASGLNRLANMFN